MIKFWDFSSEYFLSFSLIFILNLYYPFIYIFLLFLIIFYIFYINHILKNFKIDYHFTLFYIYILLVF